MTFAISHRPKCGHRHALPVLFVLNRDVGFDVKTTLEQLGKCIMHSLAREPSCLVVLVVVPFVMFANVF